MPPENRRNGKNRPNPAATATVETRPAESTEPINFAANESLKKTSMFRYVDEFYPTLPVDFTKIRLNQPDIEMDEGENAEFVAKNEIEFGKHAWISDGHDRILSTLNKRDEIPVLTIHWLIRQSVVVKGDETDL